MRRLVSLLLIGLLALVPACGSNGESGEGDGNDNGADGENGDGNGDDGANGGQGGQGTDRIDAIEVGGGGNGQPNLDFEPPFQAAETESEVLEEGDGEQLNAGEHMVVVDYVGVNGRDGKPFDSSWERGKSAPFPLEEGGIIHGFLQGLDGEQVGSRVLITMTPQDGYPQGNPQAGIEQGDSLIFVVDIKGTEPLLSGAEGEPAEPEENMPEVVTGDGDTPTGVETPDGQPGNEVTASTVIQGDGAEVGQQDTASVNFLIANWDNGEVIESTWEAGQPAAVPVQNASQMLPGLSEGLVGQNVGSRVTVVVPGALEDQPEMAQQLQLEPDATLVYVVDIRGAAASSS